MINGIDIEEKLDRTINYINSLRICCDSVNGKNTDLEDISKYLEISLDNITDLFNILVSLNNGQNEYNNKKNLKKLRKSYIISEKAIKKYLYIKRYYEESKQGVIEYNDDFSRKIHIITDYFEDILDEIMDYLTNSNYIN